MQRILVVEDEFLIAAHISDLLEDDGLEVVGPAASLSKAVDLASSEALDGALLDINIIGGRVDHVADILARRGVPFIFVSAYGRDHLPTKFMDAPLVNKPFKDSLLMREVRRISQHASNTAHMLTRKQNAPDATPSKGGGEHGSRRDCGAVASAGSPRWTESDSQLQRRL